MIAAAGLVSKKEMATALAKPPAAEPKAAVASGSCGVPRPSLADYVTGMEPTGGAIAAGRMLGC